MPGTERSAQDGVILGLDLGGTNLRVAGVTRTGEVVRLHREPTRADSGPEAVVGRVLGALRRVREACAREGRAVRGVVLGVPGIISQREGTVVSSPNLPGWRDLPLRERVQREIDLPVHLENDANAAAWGESWAGAGRGCGSLVLLTLGTGVGGGLVLAGELWRGAEGMAGEVGHITVEPEGRLCPCGNRGCLEAYASATAIAAIYAERAPGGGGLTAEEVHHRARQGDPAARATFAAAARALGIAFASLVNLLNPELIVIGGGLLPAWALLVPPAEQEMRRRAFAAPCARMRVVPAALGDMAGIVGAAGLQWARLARARA